MNDPLIARFADACGATGPLALRVDLADGTVLAEGSVDQPFTLVGRDDSCDVTLADAEVNMRHAWLQVLGGRVFAVDLGSRTGLVWPGCARGSGWLDVGAPVRIGPFVLHLRSKAAEEASTYPAGYNPLAADTGAKSRPVVALEFRNGKRAKDRWNVNRLVTLIGRAADCKIHLTAEDISPYHCGIVSAKSGLWVVDLSGRGVVVNGERMRVAPLPQGAELWVGRFLIGCQYHVTPGSPAPPPPSPGGKSGRLSVTPPPPPGEARFVATPAPIATPLSPPRGHDELDPGEQLDAAGLPASHIMAGAFGQCGQDPGSSNPISISGSSSTPAAVPARPAGDDRSIAPLLRHLADWHAQSAAGFQQSLALVSQVFCRVKREHLAMLQQELARIQELTAEIDRLQSEVARQVLDHAAAERARQAAPPPPESAGANGEGWVPPSAKTPLPDTPAPRALTEPAAAPPPSPRDAERLAALLQDRLARWQALSILFAGE